MPVTREPEGTPPADPEREQGDPGKGEDDDRALAKALGPLVRLEAHRTASEASIRPDPRRLEEGWERRFVAEGPRAEEATELYRELGYEVVADPVRPEDLAGECEACRLVAMMRFKSIYTRRPPRGGAGEEERR